jgi:hypothetical protein
MTVSDLDTKASAALLLARGAGADRAGEAVGRSARTIRRWRAEDPEFEAQVQAARREILDQAVMALGQAAADAVATLHGALHDDNPHVRVRAAVGLLAALPAITAHVSFEERLAALETAVRDGEGL